MKFDRKWVEAYAQCADGMAWGLQYVKDGGKDLPAALKGFDRADFLLWFLVKTESIPIEVAFDFLLDLSRARLNEEPNFQGGLESALTSELQRARGALSVEAECLMTQGKFRQGHAASAVAFLARMRLHVLEVDLEEALKDGQCVLNNLVAARTGSLNFARPEAVQEHKALCEWLTSRIIVAGGR